MNNSRQKIALACGLYLVLSIGLIACNGQYKDETSTSDMPTGGNQTSSFTEFAIGSKPDGIPKRAMNESLNTKTIKPRIKSQTIVKIDNTCTWTQGEGAEELYVKSIRKLSSGILIAGAFGSHHGVYKSEDDGKTWNPVPFFPQIAEIGGTEVWDIESADSGRVYATVRGSNLLIPNEAILVPVWDEEPKKPNEGQAKSDTSQKTIAGEGIFYSDDNASSWSVMTDWNTWLSVMPVGGSVVYMGNMWVHDPNNMGSIWAITVHSGWPATSGGDMYNMIGEVISEPPQNGIVDIYMSGVHIIGTAVDRLYRMPISKAVPYSYSNFGEYPWEVKLIGKNPRYFIDDGDGNLFVSTEGYGIYRSVDDGATWTNLPGAGLPDGLYTTQLVSPIPGMLLAGAMGHGVYISSDSGLSFNILETDGLDNLHVQALEINRTGGILAGTQSGIYLYPRHCLN